jgi:hypothetical protein
MQDFRDTLEECQLEDMLYIGDRFTWRTGRIRERLDRSLCNREWNALVPFLGSVNGEMTKFDHRPLLVDNEYYEGVHTKNKSSCKRFEARWLSEPTVDEIVQEAWNRAKASNRVIMQIFMNGIRKF